MLLNALRYLSLGLSVIPLKPNSKDPAILWKEFQKRRATESEVREWFRKWPNANVGIVTGSISSIVVIDLDGPEGIESAKKLGLSSSCISLTGDGKHLWYKHPGVNVENAVRVAPGMDIRGDGGYIVAPGSIHESGRRYRWLSPLTALNVTNLPVFPAAIFAENVSQTKRSKDPEAEPNFEYESEFGPERKGKPSGWIAKALEEMKDGNIDNTFTAILGRLRHDGWSSSDARTLLLPHAQRVKAETGHLEEKIENIWNRYEARSPRSTASISEFRSGDTGLIIHSPTNPDSLKQFEQLQLATDESESSNKLSTGYAKLDQMLQGGLKSSRLFTIAARTGTGKTNFLIGIARTLCEAGKRVLIFSTETPYTEFWQRYINTLRKPEEFRNHALYVCDSFAPSVEKVEEAISVIKPDVFMFDHINHVSEEQRELGGFMQGLNYLRRKYDCGGIVTAQLNRSADWIDLKTGEKVTPRMSMIKGSGTIEQASSRVLLLSETRVTPEMTEIVGNLDKNDNGPKGLIHFGLMNSPYRMVEL